MRIILLLNLIGLVLAGCTGPASATDLALNDTAPGRKLYVAKCAKCHKFYDPAKYSAGDWAKWMGKMSKKAKLSPDQEQVLSRYIEETLRPQRTNRDKGQAPP